MHACGHDSHVAIQVKTAKLLAGGKDLFPWKIRFMFRPDEEGCHGAKFRIKKRELDGVDRAFAIHIYQHAIGHDRHQGRSDRGVGRPIRDHDPRLGRPRFGTPPARRSDPGGGVDHHQA